MSDSRSDDYFSFMAQKQRGMQVRQMSGDDAARRDALAFSQTDVVEFHEEPQIEVTESFVSDTTIQRIFHKFCEGIPMAAFED